METVQLPVWIASIILGVTLTCCLSAVGTLFRNGKSADKRISVLEERLLGAVNGLKIYIEGVNDKYTELKEHTTEIDKRLSSACAGLDQRVRDIERL